LDQTVDLGPGSVQTRSTTVQELSELIEAGKVVVTV